MSEHLGYDKGEPTTQARGNARNGTTSKMVDSEVGPFEIEVPRDRAGTFTPHPGRAKQAVSKKTIAEFDAVLTDSLAGSRNK